MSEIMLLSVTLGQPLIEIMLMNFCPCLAVVIALLRMSDMELTKKIEMFQRRKRKL